MTRSRLPATGTFCNAHSLPLTKPPEIRLIGAESVTTPAAAARAAAAAIAATAAAAAASTAWPRGGLARHLDCQLGALQLVAVKEVARRVGRVGVLSKRMSSLA